MENCNVVILEDHVMLLDMLAETLNEQSRIKVIGKYSNPILFLSEFTNLFPEVILLDIDLPEMNGFDAMSKIFSQRIDQKVLIISYHDEPFIKSKFINAGARGYVSKVNKLEEIIKAIISVHENGFYLNNDVSLSLVNSIIQYNKIKLAYPEVVFNKREIELIRLICKEKTAKEIGSILFIETKTVEAYKRNIMQKLNVKSSIGIVIYAVQSNLC
jgi:DNA-binding NarL/FixJ family response regulator